MNRMVLFMFTPQNKIIMKKNTFFWKLIKQIITIFLLFVTGIASGQTPVGIIKWWGENTASISFPVAATPIYNSTYFDNNSLSTSSYNYSAGPQSLLQTVSDNRNVWKNMNISSTLDVSVAPYISYTVAPKSSVQSINFDRFVIQALAITGSPASSKLELRWSVDGFASNLGSFSTNHPDGGYYRTSVDLSATGSVSTTQPIEFRIYMYNAPVGGQWIYMPTGSGYSTLDNTPAIYGQYDGSTYLYGYASVAIFASGLNNAVTYTPTISPPTITSFSPTSGAVGSTVTITGTGFNTTASSNVVYLGGMKCPITTASSTSLVVTIPKGSNLSHFQVVNTSSKLSALSGKKFIVKSETSGAQISTNSFRFNSPVSLNSFSAVNPNSYTTADIDGNGKLDILAMTNGYSLKIGAVSNTPSSLTFGTTTVGNTVLPSPGYSTLSYAQLKDMNNDGLLDYITANGGQSGGWVNINSSTSGTPSFSNRIEIAPNASYRFNAWDVAVGDYNMDGKMDVIGAYWLNGIAYYCVNTSSNGTYSESTTFTDLVSSASYATGARAIVSGDFNNDGKEDYYVTGSSSSSYYLRNTATAGAATLSFSASTNQGLNADILRTADLDGDGDLDIIAANNTNRDIFILTNDGNGIFTKTTITEPSSQQIKGIELGDLDGDGDVDLVYLSSYGFMYVPNISSSANNISFDFTNRVDLAGNLSPSNGFKLVDVNEDNKLDILYESGGSMSILENKVGSLPTITSTGTLTNFTTCSGTASTTQTFTVSGSNLTANIDIAAVTGYEYSTDNTTFSSTLSVAPTSGTVASITIYVRMTAASTGTPSGNISISSTGATTQTIAVSGTVNAVMAISSQPTATVNLCQGASYTLGASATGSGSLTYQWYSNTSNSNTGGTSLGNTNNAQTSALTPSTTVPGTNYYYLVVTGACGPAISNVSTIIVSPTPVAGTASAATTAMCSGNSTTLSLTGPTGSIQWQSSLNNSTWTNISGATAASYTSPVLTATTYYRAVVSSGGCTAVNSNLVTITVTNIPVPTLATPSIQTFTAVGATNWTAPAGVNSVEYLVVGGGGGGGNGWDQTGGGGGGGGMVLTGRLTVSPGTVYPITIGDGGIGGLSVRTTSNGSVGQNTQFASIKAFGGGKGYSARSSTSNTGLAQNFNCESAFGGSGGVGGSGGKGGGGATGNGGNNSGTTPGTGGLGFTSSITGTSTVFGTGGAGGGTSTLTGTDGTINRGNGGRGGGATSSSSAAGGKGGSGIVVLKYTVQANAISYCQGATAFPLQATATNGYSLQWYTVPTGGVASSTAPTPDTSTSGTTTYYVSQKDNISGCESDRIAIVVTVNSNPASPTVPNSVVNYCQGDVATPLAANAITGNTLQWYNGVTPLTYCAPTPSTTTASTTTYNVTQFVNVTGCESTSTSITVNVYAAPVAGTATAASSTVCSGGTATITLANSTGNIQWQQLVGSTWTDIAGETSSTLTTPAISQGTSFRAKLSGQYCTDVFSNVVNITLTTAPVSAGFGLDFDGSNDIITIPNSATYDYTTSSAFTIEAWVKINTSASSINTIVGKKTPGGGTSGYAFYINSWGSSDRKVVFEATGGTFISTTSIPNNTWTHVAVSVASGGAATIYINGVASGTGTITIPSNSNTINVGAFGNNGYFYFNGGIDEVRIWDVAKTASEINTFKNSDVRGFANLQLYYKLNEGTSTIANDSSPNANHGSLNNFALSGSRSNWVASSFQDVASISGNSTICLGATTILTHTVSGGAWSSATTSVATIDSNGVVTAVDAGTSVISYTYTYNGCSFTDTKTITVMSTPVAPTVTNTMDFCQSSTASLAATASSGHTLKWYTVASGGAGTTTLPVVSTSTATSTPYYVSQVSTSTGCESPRATITAVINPLPEVTGTGSIEVGGTVTLTATTTPATNNAWVSSNTSVATVDNSGVVTAVATGSAVITYTNSTGCSTTKNISVVVGTTLAPVLTHPASNLTGATTFRINYTLPEAPRAGSVRLTFVPVLGGNPVIWTMSNATTVDFNYTVTAQPNATYVTSGAALSYGTYNVTLSYQDVYSSPVATATATNIQTLAPPSISFTQSSYTGLISVPMSAITPTNTGGAINNYSISPSLPNGLTFNTSTGVISGTPIVAQPQTNYTITATNAAGSDAKVISILIDADSDGDGVPDSVEVQQGTNPNQSGDALDTDGDGVPDYIEVQQGTNPNQSGDALDTDGDGVPDYIEVQQGTNPTTPGALDTDGDGVPDYIEVQQGTNPNAPGALDTDGDGVPDYIEVQQGTNPNQSGDALDTDGDGVPDYIEVQQGTNPNQSGDALDTDGDGVPDYIEVQQGTNPTTPGALDTDGDGVPDYIEVQQGTNPSTAGDVLIDTDGDGIPDYIEIQLGTNPIVPDTLDSDHDGISNYKEGYNYSNPNQSLDTDHDGVPDYLDQDSDGDGVLDINDAFPINRLEWTDSDHDGIGNNADTDDDNDGILDGCDVDTNGDGIPDNGTDMDGDGIIDSCDADRDGDGVNNTSDNCPNSPNANQADRDHDGKGDVCDTIELNAAQAITPNGDGINDTWVIYNLGNHPGSTVRVFNSNGLQVFYSANYQNNWSGNYQGSSEMLPVGSYLYQIDLGGDGSIDEQGWLYITK
jgi:gliding motility-associated-like protein